MKCNQALGLLAYTHQLLKTTITVLIKISAVPYSEG